MAKKPKINKQSETVTDATQTENVGSTEPSSHAGDRVSKLDLIKGSYPVGTVLDLKAFENIRGLWAGRLGAINDTHKMKVPVDSEDHLVVSYKIDETGDQIISGYLHT